MQIGEDDISREIRLKAESQRIREERRKLLEPLNRRIGELEKENERLKLRIANYERENRRIRFKSNYNAQQGMN